MCMYTIFHQPSELYDADNAYFCGRRGCFMYISKCFFVYLVAHCARLVGFKSIAHFIYINTYLLIYIYISANVVLICICIHIHMYVCLSNTCNICTQLDFC